MGLSPRTVRASTSSTRPWVRVSRSMSALPIVKLGLPCASHTSTGASSGDRPSFWRNYLPRRRRMKRNGRLFKEMDGHSQARKRVLDLERNLDRLLREVEEARIALKLAEEAYAKAGASLLTEIERA